MKRKLILFFLLVFIHSIKAISQKEVTSFIFGHSLIHHEFQINTTPSQETSIPHWLHFLSKEAGHIFKVSGQYGFLPQHANLPPSAQWGFDFVEGAWDSDNEMFSEANFSNIIITPGNFIQWQSPSENYPMDAISPVNATESIFSWCNQQEDELKFYIYENWPDMAPFLSNNFPPSENEWLSYNEYLNTEFHNWYLDYHNSLVGRFPNSCIKIIPVGTLISDLLSQSPYNEIPIEELYEDDAPHGRASIYFLASIITYMAIYEEKAPLDFEVQSIIHPLISNNYSLIVDYLWVNLNSFNYDNTDSRVFCDQLVTSTTAEITDPKQVRITPNPTLDFLTIESSYKSHLVSIVNSYGQLIVNNRLISPDDNILDLGDLTTGVYFLIGEDVSNEVLYTKTFVKQR